MRVRQIHRRQIAESALEEITRQLNRITSDDLCAISETGCDAVLNMDICIGNWRKGFRS